MTADDVLPFPSVGRAAVPVSRTGPTGPTGPTGSTGSTGPEPLWREIVGRELRARRQDAHRTLSDVAGAAGISVQYLSEIERGLKEPSSEILGAVHQALGLRLVDLTDAVSRRLGSTVGSGPVCLSA